MSHTVPNDWIERVEQMVRELLRKENFDAQAKAVYAVPPATGLDPAMIFITPKSDGVRCQFVIRPPRAGDDSNLNEDAGRILKELNVALEKRLLLSDYDPLDPERP